MIEGSKEKLSLHTPPSSVVVAGDWHANAKYAVRAVEWARDTHNADTIIHVGDFGYTFPRAFLDALSAALAENNQRLYFVDGNHDNHELLASLATAEDGTRPLTDSIAYLPRGLRWEWYGVRYLALGGAHSVDRQARTPGVSWWGDERISMRDVLLATAGGPADVMFTHDCPSGVEIKGLRSGQFPPDEIRASESNRELLRAVMDEVNPGFVYCGHYHVRQSASIRNGMTRVEILDRDEMWFKENMVPLGEGLIP
jgi:Icc-related predicted phosphoesterase